MKILQIISEEITTGTIVELPKEGKFKWNGSNWQNVTGSKIVPATDKQVKKINKLDSVKVAKTTTASKLKIDKARAVKIKIHLQPI